MNISAVVLTKNEENNIEECLKSLDFCQEIIVVDDDSIDKTREIVRKYGPDVYRRSLSGDFSGQRNFGLAKAKNEWVLFVDVDERLTPRLKEEIKSSIAKYGNTISGFYLKRQDCLWGQTLKFGETAGVRLIRLAKKRAGIWKRRVHEFWDIKGPIRELKNPLLHYPHKALQEFIKDIDFFSTLHCQANFQEGKRANLLKIIFYPPLKFTVNYFFKLGFLDSIPGFISSLMMSLHSYLAWSKLWIWQKKKK